MADVNKMITPCSDPKDDGGDGVMFLAMAVTLATLTGVRRGELAGLRWTTVDEESVFDPDREAVDPGSGGQYLGPCKSSERLARAVVLGAEGTGVARPIPPPHGGPAESRARGVAPELRTPEQRR